MFYSFDSGAFINGRRDLFRPEVFPTLWANIDAMIQAGVIRSVDVVRDELAKRDDDVTRWARQQRDLFVPLTRDVQLATRRVLAEHKKLVGVGGRRNAADPFVVALAIVHGGTVVTQELKSGSTTKPRIPDVCEGMDVPWLSLPGFVADQGWTF